MILSKRLALLLIVSQLWMSVSAFMSSPSVSLISSSQLFMVTTIAPPPPIEQGKVIVPSSSSAALISSSSVSNLPSQKELAEKSQTVPVPTKAVNLASGAGITITDINYDGVVPKTESDEYVVITNNSKTPVDASGYYVYPASTGTQGPTFYFPKGTTLKAGTSIRIYTNEIHKETGGYSFGSGKALWSNSGGLGVLKDSDGKKLTEFK
mmetsp:Transcript_19707/g.22831  ORF Transcript_19707/g.22831 Transcript_19707/m.22831 type:complete len:209 (+) Transcript_19707:167-793(+)